LAFYFHILLDPIAWLHVVYLLLLDFRFYIQGSEHGKGNCLTLNKDRNY